MRPDRVGEALVAREDKDGKLAGAAVDRGRGKAALTVLTRLGATGEEWPLRRLIDARREVLVEEVIAVAQETGDPVGRVLAESLDEHPDAALARSLMLCLPTRSLACREVAVACARQAILTAQDDEERFALLSDFSARAGDIGNAAESLESAQGAVDIAKRLAQGNPSLYDGAVAVA